MVLSHLFIPAHLFLGAVGAAGWSGAYQSTYRIRAESERTYSLIVVASGNEPSVRLSQRLVATRSPASIAPRCSLLL